MVYTWSFTMCTDSEPDYGARVHFGGKYLGGGCRDVGGLPRQSTGSSATEKASG